MGLTMESFRNTVVSGCLWDIRARLLSLRDELMFIGVPLETIEINNWPEFDKDDVHIKIWDGNNHIKGTGKPGNTHMTPLDVIAFVKRRQILKRKFST